MPDDWRSRALKPWSLDVKGESRGVTRNVGESMAMATKRGFWGGFRGANKKLEGKFPRIATNPVV